MMRNKTVLKKLSLLLCAGIVAAIVLLASGCKDSVGTSPSSIDEPESITQVGSGSKTFSFSVVELNGRVTEFLVSTDKATVGEALQEVGLIEGEMGAYGLYVKKVNGIEADYDKDATYWAFFENDAMAALGADSTEIKEGVKYSFRVSK